MSRSKSKLILLLVALLVVLIWKGPGVLSPPHTPAVADSAGGEAAILDAFRARRSNVIVEAAGVVSRLLPDDREGSRHQRIIVKLPSGHTVLIAHNIDLAPRIPAKQGDGIEFRGQYEWNAEGGVVHWTHLDPQGRHAGGFIRHGGRTFE